MRLEIWRALVPRWGIHHFTDRRGFILRLGHFALSAEDIP
jgi:hypothetical protein